MELKIFECAVVEEFNDFYLVKSLINSNETDFQNENHIGLNTFAAIAIKDALTQNKIVRINKQYLSDEVHIFDLVITIPNLDNVDVLRLLLIQNARQLITHQQANISGLMMYEFININNVLCSKGYFIHDDNREDEYLKILETEDEKLIDQLEIFLNARDVISRSSFLENRYSQHYTSMHDAKTQEELYEISNSFISTVKTFQS